MILTNLHWVEGPWPGKLALAARPRGGDWLADEIANWRREGVDGVWSLLEPAEERELDLEDEGKDARALGMGFRSFPIADRKVPESERDFVEAIEGLDRELSAGRNVVVHCRQGVGRTGLVAACLLSAQGVSAQSAVERLSKARGLDVPETAAQRDWIDRFAGTLAFKR